MSALVAVGLLGACATGASVDEDPTRRLRLDAAAACEKRFPNVRYFFESDGTLRLGLSRREGAIVEAHGFKECFDNEVERRTPPLSRGRLASNAPAYAVVRVDVERGGVILAPMTINGTFHGRLIVDTGASMTILWADAAKALGLAPAAGARRLTFRLADGRTVRQPVVRIASLRIGDMLVEDLDVAVSEGGGPGDGLLGQNFLGHFRVTIERENSRLVLDSGRPVPPPRVTATSTRTWTPPAALWSLGDTWRYSWRAPAGSGTYENRVIGDETVDGVRRLVIDAGGRRYTFRADTVGLSTEHAADGSLVARYSPPVGQPWPLRVGATWDVDAEWETAEGRAPQRFFLRCAAMDEPTITVPAGTFQTLRVMCQNRLGVVVRETWWAVEPRTWVRDRAIGRDGESIHELLSYSLR